jgi:hypothetical protein
MVGRRQFMIVCSEHGRRVQRSWETLTDQEKQEIQSEYKKYRSVGVGSPEHRLVAVLRLTRWLASQECAAM